MRINKFVLRRREENLLKSSSGWLLVYGRRKVGKTFLVRRSFSWSLYATVTRSREVIIEEGRVRRRFSQREAMEVIAERLRRGEVVVLDEFQRLDERFWDDLALLHPHGRLILCGSSLGIVEKVFDRRSPLLGLVMPVRIDLARYADAVLSLKEQGIEGGRCLLWAVLIRDPWIIPMVNLKLDPLDDLSSKIYGFYWSAKGLVGEIFEEEERRLTLLYEAVLREVGGGAWNSAKVAGRLAATELLPGGVAAASGIMERMVEMGLLQKIPLWRSGRSRFFFKHRSPIMHAIYYLDQKLNLGEEEVAVEEVKKRLTHILAHEFAFSVGELMAEVHKGTLAYTITPEGDIDVVIMDARRRKPRTGYEVKLGEITAREALQFAERIRSLGVPRAGLVSMSKKPPMLKDIYESYGPEELTELALKHAK